MGRSSASFVVEDGWTLGVAVEEMNEYKVGSLLASGASADADEQFFDPGRRALGLAAWFSASIGVARAGADARRCTSP